MKRKGDFDNNDLPEKRIKGEELEDCLDLHKKAPLMLDKLNSGGKLSAEEVELAKKVGIECNNGVPKKEDMPALEGFAEDYESKKEIEGAIETNKKQIEDIIKAQSNNESANSSSGSGSGSPSTSVPSNFQDSSDITADGELPDYFDDLGL